MSVRAYRINNIDYAEENTFNLWHDTELLEFIDEKEGFGANQTDGGIGEVSVETLKEILRKVKLEKWVKDNIKKDIEWAKKNEKEYIQYYCL